MPISSTKRFDKSEPTETSSDETEDLRKLCIGPRIRTARHLRGMTLNELAAQSGYSASLLSRIENEKSLPSIPTLLRLSKALDVDLISFFRGDGDSNVLTKPHERQRVSGLRHSEEIEVEILVSPAEGRILEGFLVKLGPGADGGSPLSHEGEEMGYVIDGEIELTVAGRVHLAETGDSFHFPSNLDYSYSNTGSVTATVIWISTPPPSASCLRV